MISFSFRLWILALVVLPNSAMAAACCGGGSSAPALITTDDRAQMSVSFVQADDRIFVDTEKKWYKSSANKDSRSFILSGAFLISDRWQAGFEMPTIQRKEGSQSSSYNIGDLSANLGYEFLPEWNYSSWRPKGIGYIKLTAPTGRSRFDSDESQDQLNISGKGLWNFSMGALFTKARGAYDFLATAELRQALERKINGSSGEENLKPGLGGSMGAGLGYNWADYRFGFMLTASEDRIVSNEKVWTSGVSFAYLASPSFSAVVSYQDQSLFGVPENTTLEKTVNILFQSRWAR